MSWLAFCISTCPRGTTLGMKGQEHYDKAEERRGGAQAACTGDDQDTAAAWAAVAAWAITGPTRIGVRSPRPGSSRRECPNPGFRASARCPDPDPAKPGHPLTALPRSRPAVPRRQG